MRFTESSEHKYPSANVIGTDFFEASPYQQAHTYLHRPVISKSDPARIIRANFVNLILRVRISYRNPQCSVPENCCFEVGGAEHTWIFPHQFDYIHVILCIIFSFRSEMFLRRGHFELTTHFQLTTPGTRFWEVFSVCSKIKS